jgi:membrane protein
LHRLVSHAAGKEKQSVKHRAHMVRRTALDFWSKLDHDGFFYLAAILAYTLLMSIIPLLAVLLSVLNGVLGVLAPHVQQQLLGGVGKLILPPSISSKLLQPALQTASQGSGWVGIIALLFSAWLGSRLFVAIEHCFSIVFRFPKRAMVRQNLMALLMLLVFALLLPLLLAVPVGMTILSSKIADQVLGNAASIRLWLTITGLVASFVVASAFFLVIYLVVPNCPVHVREAGPGALIAGALLQLYNLAFPFYTAHFLPFANYGAAMGLTLLILLFFYYFGLILLLGAEINAFWAGQQRAATEPSRRLDRAPVRNQSRDTTGSTAGQPQEDVQAKSPGLDIAGTSPADG